MNQNQQPKFLGSQGPGRMSQNQQPQFILPQSQQEKIEEGVTYLPDLYIRKFRLVEKLTKFRPDYIPTQIIENKPLKRPLSQWDLILEEMKSRYIEFREEKKFRQAQCYQIAKRIKRDVSKNMYKKDENNLCQSSTGALLQIIILDVFDDCKTYTDDNTEFIERKFKKDRVKQILEDIKMKEDEEKKLKLEEEEKSKIKQEAQQEKEEQQPPADIDMFLSLTEEEKVKQEEDKKMKIEQEEEEKKKNEQEELEKAKLKEEYIENKEEKQVKMEIEECKKKRVPKIALFIKKMLQLNNEEENLQQQQQQSEEIICSNNISKTPVIYLEDQEIEVKGLQQYKIAKKYEMFRTTIKDIQSRNGSNKRQSKQIKNESVDVFAQDVVDEIIQPHLQFQNYAPSQKQILQERFANLSSGPDPLMSHFTASILKQENNLHSLPPIGIQDKTSSETGCPTSSQTPHLGAINADQQQQRSQLSQKEIQSQQQHNSIQRGDIEKISGVILNSKFIDTAKKRKKKEDVAKDNFNEEFMNSGYQLNPNLEFKKQKYENVAELLSLYYDANIITDTSEFTKMFEKTCGNHKEFPKCWDQIEELPIVPPSYVEVSRNSLFDNNYENFLNVHNVNISNLLIEYQQKLPHFFEKDAVLLSEQQKNDLFNKQNQSKIDIRTLIAGNLLQQDKQPMSFAYQNKVFEVIQEKSLQQKHQKLEILNKTFHFYFLIEKMINLWGNNWQQINQNIQLHPFSKGLIIKEYICQSLYIDFLAKRGQKIINLENKIIPASQFLLEMQNIWYFKQNEQKKKYQFQRKSYLLQLEDQKNEIKNEEKLKNQEEKKEEEEEDQNLTIEDLTEQFQQKKLCNSFRNTKRNLSQKFAKDFQCFKERNGQLFQTLQDQKMDRLREVRNKENQKLNEEQINDLEKIRQEEDIKAKKIKFYMTAPSQIRYHFKRKSMKIPSIEPIKEQDQTQTSNNFNEQSNLGHAKNIKDVVYGNKEPLPPLLIKRKKVTHEKVLPLMQKINEFRKNHYTKLRREQHQQQVNQGNPDYQKQQQQQQYAGMHPQNNNNNHPHHNGQPYPPGYKGGHPNNPLNNNNYPPNLSRQNSNINNQNGLNNNNLPPKMQQQYNSNNNNPNNYQNNNNNNTDNNNIYNKNNSGPQQIPPQHQQQQNNNNNYNNKNNNNIPNIPNNNNGRPNPQQQQPQQQIPNNMGNNNNNNNNNMGNNNNNNNNNNPNNIPISGNNNTNNNPVGPPPEQPAQQTAQQLKEQKKAERKAAKKDGTKKPTKKQLQAQQQQASNSEIPNNAGVNPPINGAQNQDGQPEDPNKPQSPTSKGRKTTKSNKKTKKKLEEQQAQLQDNLNNGPQPNINNGNNIMENNNNNLNPNPNPNPNMPRTISGIQPVYKTDLIQQQQNNNNNNNNNNTSNTNNNIQSMNNNNINNGDMNNNNIQQQQMPNNNNIMNGHQMDNNNNQMDFNQQQQMQQMNNNNNNMPNNIDQQQQQQQM